MSNEKNYPLHPNQSHPPIMTCEIPLEEYESIKRENTELKAKLESVQATAYADSVDAGMENRKLKRALWLTRACSAEDIANHFATIDEYDPYNRYNLIFCVLPSKGYNKFMYAEEWKNIFQKIKDKCRAKAEQYK